MVIGRISIQETNFIPMVVNKNKLHALRSTNRPNIKGHAPFYTKEPTRLFGTNLSDIRIKPL